MDISAKEKIAVFIFRGMNKLKNYFEAE